MGHKDVVVIGDSTSEVFDYIFGDNPQYHPFWATGWSCRGLNSDENVKYITHILKNISRDSICLLNFGTVDIDFNLRFKIKYEAYSNYDAFVKDMASGIVFLKNLLVQMGFKEERIYATFLAPPIRLEQEYWLYDNIEYPNLSTQIRGKLHQHFSEQVSQYIQSINLLMQLSDNFKYSKEQDFFYPALSGNYIRSVPDHHQDYTKTQRLIWNEIKSISNIIPNAKIPLKTLYPHYVFGIKELREEMMPRPRTTSIDVYSRIHQYTIDKFSLEKKQSKSELKKLFIGDEIFSKWRLRDLFEDCFNFAFRGAQIVDYNYFLWQIFDNINPKKIYIHLGLNDLLFGKSIDIILYDLDCLLKNLRKIGLDGEINIISILPNVNQWELEEQILSLNSSIQDLIKDKYKINYLDIHSQFLNNNEPNNLFFDDLGQSLNEVGYNFLQKQLGI